MNILKKDPFWLGCIGGVVALIAVYFVLVFPKERGNRALVKKVDELKGQIAQLSKDPGLARQEWLDQAQRQRRESEQEIAVAALEVLQVDEQLESFVGDVPPGAELPNAVSFRQAYDRCCAELQQLFSERRIAVAPNAFGFKDWGPDIPLPEEIRLYMKRLWVQDGVARVLSQNPILEFQYMQFDNFDLTLPRNPYFICPTFELTLRMRYPDLGKLIEDLLKSPRRIRVLRVTVERELAGAAGAGAAGAKKPTAGGEAEIVHLYCDYLDPTFAVHQVRFDLGKFPGGQQDIRAWLERMKASTEPQQAGFAYLARLLARPETFERGKPDGEQWAIELASAKAFEDDTKRFPQGLGLLKFSVGDGVAASLGPLKVR